MSPPSSCLQVLVVFTLVSTLSAYFGGGLGVCDGGACGQCSPLVYNAENSLLVSFQKLSRQLINIQNKMVADINSIKLPVKTIQVSVNNAYTTVNSQVKRVNAQILAQLNQLVVLINQGGKGEDLKQIHSVLVSIQQLQSVLQIASSNLIDLANQVITQHGNAGSGFSISQVTVSLTKLRSSIVQISRDIMVVVSKIDKLSSASDSISLVVNKMKISVDKIKSSLTSFVSLQQSMVSSLRSILRLQRNDIKKINAQIKSISIKSSSIDQSLKISKTSLVGSFNDISRINANVKQMNVAVLRSETIIKKQSAKITSLVNRMRVVSNMIKKDEVSFNSMLALMNELYNKEVAFLQKITANLRYVDEYSHKLRVLKRETQAMLSRVLSKVSAIKRTEETNSRSLLSLIGSIRSDLDKLSVAVGENGKTAVKLSGEVDVLERRMAIIMSYLRKLEDQCKATPPVPPARCEGSQFTCNDAPVCASDGNEYISSCEMNKVACLTNTVLTVKNSGPCVHSTTTPTTPTNCDFTCDPIIKPVCANDGKTYSCYCEMKLVACLRRINLYVVSQGSCGGVIPTASSCNFFCTAGQTICGSDGVTYASMCKMLEAVCWSKTLITKKHDGKCGGACPSGFINLKNACFYFHRPQKGKNLKYAIADCKLRGGHLASFSSDEQWKAVQQHFLTINKGNPLKPAYYWTAALISASNQWSWYHSHTVHFNLKFAWKDGVVPLGNGQQGCGLLSGLDVYKMVRRPCTATPLQEFGWLCSK